MIRSRLTPRAVAGFAALLVAVGTLGLSSAAVAADDDASVSWSVSPADETGPDGRIAIEHELDPGESAEDRIVVRNLGAEQVVFSLSAADGFYTSSGRFDMLPSNQESVDAGTWISLTEEVTIPAGDQVIVPFTLTVPEGAEPGDHAAGVAASVLSVQGDGTGVGVESRVGIKVLTRVTGEVVPAFKIADLEADYQMSWNPFRAGGASVDFTIENTGNVRLDAAGMLDLGGQQVAFPADQERRQELLPGERRSFSLTVDDIWPLFVLNGEVLLAPTAVTLAGDAVAVTPVSTSVFLWAIPWPHLLLAIGVVLVVLALFWNRGRTRRRVDAMIEIAVERGREQGRSESLGPEEQA